MRFSDRLGFTKPRSTYQIDQVDTVLRNQLWEILISVVLPISEYNIYDDDWKVKFRNRYAAIYRNFFKSPTDAMPRSDAQCRDYIRKWFFECNWYELYNFLEFVSVVDDSLEDEFNAVLEREKSAYRFVNSNLVAIVQPEQIEEIQKVLLLSAFSGARKHIARAIDLFGEKPQADYRNCVKEAISAAESAAKEATGSESDSLGQALKRMPLSDNLHPSLKEAFVKLYGYASDEKGVRHALKDGNENVGEAEAHFMIVAASAFVSYVSKKVLKSDA